MEKTKAKLLSGGQGGFLNPPTHPEHHFHVEHKFKKDGEFYICLSTAVTEEWIEDSIRERAKALLDNWEANKLPLDNEEVRDWIHQCLGYFRNCYSPDAEGEDRNVSNCKIININPFQVYDDKREKLIKRHLGILFIKEYYPEYEPKAEDFINAYWGKKPENIVDEL